MPKRNQLLVFTVVLIPALVGVYSIIVAMRQQVRFVSARQVVDPIFLDSVIRENYTGFEQLDPKVVRQNGFLIFDFRSQELCGVAGCLYSAYVDGDHISFYLQKAPNNVDLFTFEQHGTAKCFVTAQSGEKGIIRTRYCHQQGRLAKVITELSNEK
ncbi:hypothetical protein [Coleofasciculus sp.]|uniref:hypothetical protein n=1 Tax=Coleofasciculus sp. TaxID=3100458 RepID=UPI003A2B5416